MSHKAPQTLSVKRKRNEVPVDHLIVERNHEERKRLKSDSISSTLKRKLDLPQHQDKRVKGDESSEGTVVWRRIAIPRAPTQHITSHLPPPTPTRRFHVSRAAGNVVLLEDRGVASKIEPMTDKAGIVEDKLDDVSTIAETKATSRKRPGARLPPKTELAQKLKAVSNGPSEDVIRQFEKFSNDIENEEVEKTKLARLTSPSKFKPKPPKLRYKDRHPEQAAALEANDADAMQVDGDDYVYDTYVREIILPDANGKIPEPQGSVGFIVLTEEDEEWWFGEDESDREFDTDDEDSNAEDYYANDYPEDEMDSEDEFDRGAYDFHHGEDDEEYDLDDDARSDQDEGKLFRQTIPKTGGVYWGRAGEDD